MFRLGRVQQVIITVLVALAVLASLALSQVNRDDEAPVVFAELPHILPSGDDFKLDLSANEPVSYQIIYGDTRVEQEVEHENELVSFELSVLTGAHPLLVVARDKAKNERDYFFEIYGVPLLQPLIRMPEQVKSGEAVTVSVEKPPDAFGIQSLSLSLDGKPLELFELSDDSNNLDEIVSLFVVPLGSAGEHDLELYAVDRFNRVVTAKRSLTAVAEPLSTEDLNLPASIYSVFTPENTVLERDTLAAAYASSTLAAPLWIEAFVAPITGEDSSGFGDPRRYVSGGAVSFHTGADIVAYAGTPVKATNTGKVVVAGFYPIKGGFVMIDHGAGVYSLYFHQSRLDVDVGDKVQRGQIIGAVGSTGLSTGAHLHWEMRVDGVPSNPRSWIGKRWPNL